MALLEISNLQLAMGTFEGEKTVLRDVNLVVEKGSITGVVGETGSGKSLTGLSISRLVPTPPGRYVGGTIRFDGRDILSASEAEMQRLRGRDIGMIFQDPTTNLNPAFRIGTQMVDMALAAARDDAGLLGLPSHAGRRERAACSGGSASSSRSSASTPIRTSSRAACGSAC
jgi:ABC-type dipeptide/oligopeptide/nickel transport system ATPase component